MGSGFRAVSGPLVVAMWQLAPVTAAEDSLGRVRITFGYGAGRYEQTVDCAGNVIGVTDYDYDAGGVQVDAWPTRNLRLTGFGGSRSTSVRTEGTFPPDPYTDDLAGRYYGFQIALETRVFGIGGGQLLGRHEFQDAEPNIYLRIGDIDDLHFRADVNAPGPVFGATGVFRLGVEKNSGHIRGTRWFFGAGFCHFCGDTIDPAFVGEMSLPAFGRFDVMGQGLLGPGENSAVWSWGLGVRASF